MNNRIQESVLSEDLPIEIGKPARDFTLLNHLGEEWKLSSQRGKVLALLFYPQNETLVCTRQLCSVRDHWQEYLAAKAAVVGISPNSVQNHQNFSQKYKLPLPILADDSGQITNTYCRHWIFPVNFMRAVVIIDADGIIRSHKIMLRAVRPSDRSVIASIYAARADEINKTYASLAERLHSLIEYRF